MHRLLHELISNPNYLSSSEVYDKLSDQGYYDELSSIFGSDFVENLKSSQNDIIQLKSISNVPFPKRYDEYTQIYVWGGEKVGKTSLIGSIFAAIEKECKNTKWTVDSDTIDRISDLQKFFSNKNTCFSRLKDTYSQFQVYNVDCVPKGAFQHTSYPLSFIEANTMDVTRNPMLSQQLQSNNNKIHLFCFDCSASESEQQKQAYLFGLLIKQLKSYLNTSVGVYIIVTKTDTMQHVPTEFRHNAAQTLITAKYWHLWQQVVNVCYEMNIYDSTPIPFSIGDVVLKDIIKPNLSDACSLLHYPIFLKSYRRPNFLKKILWSGGWKKTCATLVIMVGIIFYALYTAFSIIPTPPMVKPQAYKFDKDFIQRVKTDIYGRDFDISKDNFDALRYELYVENKIYTGDGNKLKDVSDKSESILANNFASILLDSYKSVYGGSNWYSGSDWNSNSTKLEEFGEYVDILCKNHIIKETLQNDFKEKLTQMKENYDNLPILSYMMYIANQCTDWDEVQYINDNYKSFLSYPYDQDETIKNFIENAIDKAHSSYSKYLYDIALEYKQNYNGQVKWGLNNYMDNSYFESVKRNYKRDTKWLNDEIKYAISHSTEEYQSGYKSAKNKLDL